VKWSADFPRRFEELIGGEPYREVADKLGISKATVGAYLTGKREPKKPVLLSIANYYGVDPMWLMGADVEKYSENRKAPDTFVDVEELSEDKRYLVEKIMSLSDAEVRGLRAIVDQVLALRG